MQGSLTVRNSTLTANTAQGGASNGSPDPGKGFGGAVFNLSGAFTAVGSTLAANTAAPNTANAEGTAVYNLAYDAATARTAQTTLRNTILGEGTGDDTLVSNRSAFITPSPNLGTANAAVGERNLVRTSSVLDGGTITGTALTTDPRLGALGNNGGPTPTMAPAQNSPAIDAGAAFGLTRDQRGLARPSNFLDVPNAADGSDIGAVERQAPAAPAAPGAGGAAPLPTFGSRARISLTLAARRIPARGPVPVRVVNANTFTVKGRLLGQTTRRQLVRRGRAKRFVKLPPPGRSRSTPERAAPCASGCPRFLRRQLVRRRRLSLRIAASVQDPGREEADGAQDDRAQAPAPSPPLGEQPPEALQALVPLAAHRGDPGGGAAERFGLELVDDLAPLARRPHQLGPAQCGEVLGHRLAGHRQLGRQRRGRRAPAGGQRLHDLPAGVVGQGREHRPDGVAHARASALAEASAVRRGPHSPTRTGAVSTTRTRVPWLTASTVSSTRLPPQVKASR